MNKLLFVSTIVLLFGIISCGKTKEKNESGEVSEFPTVKEEMVEDSASSTKIKKKPEDFVPKGYVTFDTIYGDLNKDNIEDCIFIIKGNDKSKIITDEYRGKLDRNRRGIIALLNTNDGYQLSVKNYDCFSSENEDGGVYFAPDLSVEITKGKLLIHYGHGRYGYWQYMFRYQNNDLELIGYDASSNHGPIVLNETSINFLTRKKIKNQNINENTDGDEEEIFEKTETKIKRTKLIKLSEIKDFDELEVSED